MEHIDLNLEALNFKMEYIDYEKLNEFRCEAFDELEVDWQDNGGISIYKFANQLNSREDNTDILDTKGILRLIESVLVLKQNHLNCG